jgi:hypothetical protein
MRIAWICALAALLAGPVAAQDVERGARLFQENCAVCHGAAARGDGPMAEVLVIAPPDLTMIAARYGGQFPRIGVAWMIDGRDTILSHGGDMPIFGRIFGAQSEILRSRGGQTLLTSPEIVDLVGYLEGIQVEM